MNSTITKKLSTRLLLVLLSPFTLLYAAEVEDVRIWHAPDHTRLVFDLSGGVDYNLFTLANPDRVVIDIEESSLATNFSGLDFTSSSIRGIRSALRAGNTLRVVLDLDTEMRPSSFTLAPNSESGHRLVVDLYGESPTSAITGRSTSVAAPRANEKRDIIVAISAGHGGEDPGGLGQDGRLKEKNVTLAISRALYDQLKSMPGYEPILIRDGDYYVELQRRTEIARDSRADLFIALHTDWYRNSRASGLTVYALSGDRADRENARRVAEKENGADLLGGVGGDISLGVWDDDVALTLVSLQMAWSMEQSLIAGTRVLQSLDGITRLRRDKVQQASLQVLNSPDIPSFLIETGYLTNPAEARKLNSSSFQRRLTTAIAQGVMNYFYDAPPEGTLIAWQKENGIVPGSYSVKRGDSLSVIALRFGVSLADLTSSNNLRSNTIHIGQLLTIPGGIGAGSTEHTIRRGETLSEIAELYRITLSSLRQANDISGDRIMIGQVLKIPPG